MLKIGMISDIGSQVADIAKTQGELNALKAVQDKYGAASGELVATAIAKQLYPDTDPSKLTEDQKQTVSALASVSAGIVGGIAGGNTAGAAAGANAGKNAVENNFLSQPEKTELELAKRKLNDPDPAVREAAQKKVAELTELDISRDQKVMDACGNGKATTTGCTEARVEVIAAKNGYETGSYNSKFSQQYPDAYGQLVGLLNSTTPDAQNQQKVTEGLANYFMAATGVDYETALGYARTKQGADIIIASVALGANLQAAHSYLVSKGAVETAGSIRNVNPGYPAPGRTYNCVNCVIATDATLAGNPASALPVNHKNGIPLSVLENHYGTKFKFSSGTESITQQMIDAG